MARIKLLIKKLEAAAKMKAKAVKAYASGTRSVLCSSKEGGRWCVVSVQTYAIERHPRLNAYHTLWTAKVRASSKYTRLTKRTVE